MTTPFLDSFLAHRRISARTCRRLEREGVAGVELRDDTAFILLPRNDSDRTLIMSHHTCNAPVHIAPKVVDTHISLMHLISTVAECGLDTAQKEVDAQPHHTEIDLTLNSKHFLWDVSRRSSGSPRLGFTISAWS